MAMTGNTTVDGTSSEGSTVDGTTSDDGTAPFIAGELPADLGNCCASHNPRVHELSEALPMGYVVSQEGTKRFDQYHFDHDSVVLMGKRYGETMLEALGW